MFAAELLLRKTWNKMSKQERHLYSNDYRKFEFMTGLGLVAKIRPNNGNARTFVNGNPGRASATSNGAEATNYNLPEDDKQAAKECNAAIKAAEKMVAEENARYGKRQGPKPAGNPNWLTPPKKEPDDSSRKTRQRMRKMDALRRTKLEPVE